MPIRPSSKVCQRGVPGGEGGSLLGLGTGQPGGTAIDPSAADVPKPSASTRMLEKSWKDLSPSGFEWRPIYVALFSSIPQPT
jgi:hypothetical protein